MALEHEGHTYEPSEGPYATMTSGYPDISYRSFGSVSTFDPNVRGGFSMLLQGNFEPPKVSDLSDGKAVTDSRICHGR